MGWDILWVLSSIVSNERSLQIMEPALELPLEPLMEPPLLEPLTEPPLEDLMEPPLEGQRFCGVEDPPRGEVKFFRLSNISLLSFSLAVGADRAVPNSENVRRDVH